MIDFKAELSKYKPILEVDGVETSIKNDDMKDLFDLLKYTSGNKSK